jgi:hypothetical protein
LSYPTVDWHFDAVFYSQVQVSEGTPMLVDGFTNTYGLYPHFLNPIFKIIGLNIHNFSLVMSILTILGFVSLYLFLLRETKNKWFAIIGFGSIILSYIYWENIRNDPYFQLFPLRTIFPFIVLLLASLYKTKRNKLFFMAITFFCSLDLLWNPDMGIFTYISWTAFAIYINTAELEKPKDKIIQGLIIFGGCMLVALLTFVLYFVTIHLIYGCSPNLSGLFSTIVVASGFGFYMLPMQIIHPWIIVAFWILIGFALSISSYFQNKKDYAIIFLMCFVCIGFFSYYQGRSHTLVFAAIAPFFLTLLCLLLSKINFKTKNKQIRVFAYSGIFILLMAFPALMRFDINFFGNKNILIKKPEVPENIKANIAFIKKYTSPNEKVFIVTPYLQGIYYNETKTISVFNPGYSELFFIKDVERLRKMVNEKRIKIFTNIKDVDPKFIRVADNGEIGFYWTNNKTPLLK